MWKWLWLALLSFIALAACTSSSPPSVEEKTGTTSEAFTASTSVTWSGGGCTICGGATYACTGGAGWGDKTFGDPVPAGRTVTGVTVSVSEVGCGGGIVTVQLNGVTLGTYQPTANCSCSTCDAPAVVTYNNGGGVPGYVYGGTNTLHLQTASGTVCIARADITLTGPDAAPALTPSTSSLAFGNVVVGSTSAGQNVTVTNTGNATLTVNSATTSAQYTLLAAPGLPFNLAPGATSSAFTVAFAPTVTGVVNGTLVFGSNDPNGAKTVTLSGTGIAPAIAASPNPLGFGNVGIGASTTQILTMSNPGQATLTITSLALQGGNAADFSLVSPPSLPATVGAGSTLPLTVRFAPADHGARAAQLVIGSNAYQTPTLAVSLTGAGTGPRMVVAPASLDFGASNVGTPAATKTVTIQNTGETALTVSAVGMSGANAADFGTSSALPIVVAAGSSAQAVLTFTPSAVGTRTARATLQSDDPLNPTAQVDLTGVGTSPVIAVAPLTLDFGDVRTGTTSPSQTATITNTGNGPLIITAATLGGPDAAKFTLAALALPVTLAPNATANLSVTFSPTTVAAHTATLTVASNDPNNTNVVVQLKGNGVSPNLALVPNKIDFGAQLVGRDSAVHTADVQNAGSATLKITSLTLGGSNAPQYKQFTSPPLPATVTAGGKLTLALVFTPANLGTADAQLTIASDDPNNALAVLKLTGVGVSSLIGVSPTTLDFGTLRAGTKSAPKTVTITNLGGDAITLVDGALTGASAADFKSTTVAGKLDPGKTATASIVYQPAAGGASNAQVSFAANDTKIPGGIVALKGTSVGSVLTLDVTDLDFGHVSVGSASAPKTVKITNVTGDPVEVASVASDNPDFVIDSSAVVSVAGGAAATFSATFRPSASGDKSAKIQISLKGADKPEVAVFAKGTGDDVASSNSGGGCGCRVIARTDGATRSQALASFATLVAIAIAWSRRRRRR